MVRFVILYTSIGLLQSFGPDIGGRSLMRVSVYLLGLLMLLYKPGRGQSSFLSRGAAYIVLCLSFEFLHPDRGSYAAAAAQVLLNVAILSPCFWVSRLNLNIKTLRTLITIFWLLNASAASLGILQATYPGRFQPKLSTLIQNDTAVLRYSITLNNGEQTLRPFGFSDMPGGAAVSSSLAIIFSFPILLSSNARWIIKILAILAIGNSVNCILLTNIRTALVISVVAALSIISLYGRRGKWKQSIFLSIILSLAGVAGFFGATSLASDQVTQRFSSLVEDRDVFYKARGYFVMNAISSIADFPLGAGLGRYGMMKIYFGDQYSVTGSDLWAEIQWESWIYDGGLILTLLYSSLLIKSIMFCYNVARNSYSEELSAYASLMFAWSIAIFANTFTYCIFLSQIGFDYWLMMSCFVATVQNFEEIDSSDVES